MTDTDIEAATNRCTCTQDDPEPSWQHHLSCPMYATADPDIEAAAESVERTHVLLDLALRENVRYRRALEDIRQACLDGRVCDDVAWFDTSTTLHDFCDMTLNPADYK